MKIKEVSTKTGLTEKAIRLYIENGLIHPHVESGVYRNSYTFSETDVRELEEISVFRKAGFSIFEISLIKEMPEKLPELLEKKQMSLEIEIEEKKSMKEAMSRLEVHELGSASQIADSLRPAIRKEDDLKEDIPKRWLYIGIVLFIISIFLLYVYFKGGMYIVKFTCGFLFFLAGLISGIMTIRYMTCTSRANKLKNRGKGTVIAVIEEHGFDVAFSSELLSCIILCFVRVIYFVSFDIGNRCKCKIGVDISLQYRLYILECFIYNKTINKTILK